jgi:hypothetical protein
MRNRHRGIWLALTAMLTISVAPAFAQGRGRGRGRGNEGNRGEEHGRGHERERERRPVFSEHDREIVASYYRYHRSELPPGLARREALPPGLQRYLRRNGRLPPGLQKRIVWFPADLDRQLPPVPYGYRRCWVGNNVVIVNPRTFAIFDVSLNFTIP